MSPFFHVEHQEPAPAYRLGVVRTGAYRAIARAWSEPAILACSGGVDSSALVVLAREALRSGSVGPCLVVHVDHQSRPESGQEQDAVRRLSESIGLPFIGLTTVESGAVAGESMENVWRQRRYDALAQLAGQLGVENVVTAHTLDDQVETVLMRQFTGSGQLSMAGVTTWGAVQVIRPLIDTTRGELEAILELANIEPIIDPSNLDVGYRRNAVRHQVVPAVSSAFPGFERALVRSARLREADAAYCDDVASAEYAEHAVREDGNVGIPAGWLAGLHQAISSRVVRMAVLEIAGGGDIRELTHERISAVVEAATQRGGIVIELPYGVRASVQRGHVWIGREEVENRD